MRPAIEMRKQLVEVEDMQGVALPEAIVIGGMWPEERRYRAGQRPNARCQRCFRAPETEFHSVWHCICNQRLELAIVQEAEHLRAKAEE